MTGATATVDQDHNLVKIPWHEAWGRELANGEIVRYLCRGGAGHGLVWVASSSQSAQGYTTGPASNWLVEVVAFPGEV